MAVSVNSQRLRSTSRTHCYGELAVSSPAAIVIIVSTYFAYLGGMVRLSWPWAVDWIPKWCERNPNQRKVTYHSTNWARRRVNTLIPRSHLHTDATDRGGCSIRRDSRGIRTVCVLYPYCVRGFPPRSAAQFWKWFHVSHMLRMLRIKSVRTGSVPSPYSLRQFRLM